MGKKVALICLGLLALALFGGCRFIRIEEEARTPVKYSVVNAKELPAEILEMIEEKKTETFGMSCQCGDDLYLIRGYGQQMTGGYSIQVEELARSSNALFFRTKLLGPKDGQMQGEPSYPYIVVKTDFLDIPVTYENLSVSG